MASETGIERSEIDCTKKQKMLVQTKQEMKGKGLGC